jgi:hypothetical protein
MGSRVGLVNGKMVVMGKVLLMLILDVNSCKYTP